MIAALLYVGAINALSQQKPEIYVKTGHEGGVQAVSYSPDGKLLATGSDDGTIKLWNVSTGAELRTLKGGSDIINCIAFSSDGKTLASGYATVTLWDVESGAATRTLDGLSGSLVSISFSSDGKTLASAGADGHIRLSDVSSGSVVRSLDVGEPVTSAVFSRDGKTLVVGSATQVKLLDLPTFAVTRTLRSGGSAYPVALSPQATTIAAVVSSETNTTIKLWDASTGVERSFKGNTGEIKALAFSDDGKTLLSNGLDDSGKIFGDTIRFWDVSNVTLVRKLAVDPTLLQRSTIMKRPGGAGSVVASPDSEDVQSLAFCPTGATFVTGGSRGSVMFWTVSTGKVAHRSKGHLSNTAVSGPFAFSPDGRFFASGDEDSSVRLWDASIGEISRTLRGHSSPVEKIAFGSDSKTLITSGGDQAFVWDATTGKMLGSVSEKLCRDYDTGIPDVDMHGPKLVGSNGKIIGAACDDGTMQFWDLARRTNLKSLDDVSKEAIADSFVFSPDGRTLALVGTDITLVNLSNFTADRSFGSGLSNTTSLEFSSDGKSLATIGDEIKLWDIATGKELPQLTDEVHKARSVAFSPDGITIVTASRAGKIQLWDLATGSERLSIDATPDVEHLTFGPGGKTVAGYVSVNKIKLWSSKTGKELATFVHLSQKDWLVVTPDGLFDGSSTAFNRVLWRFNGNTFDYVPAEAFFADFFHPGLLKEIFDGNSPESPAKDFSHVDIRQPEVSIEEIDPDALKRITPLNRMVRVRIRVVGDAGPPREPDQDKTSGAKDLRLFRNGTLVKIWHGDVLKGQPSAVLDTTIPLVEGTNLLTAYAFSGRNIKSNDATIGVVNVPPPQQKGTAYVLSVGVNAYANAEFDLNYAVPDSLDFAGEFRLQQIRLGRVVVTQLNDRLATKANILKAIADIAAKIQPQDSLTIYFAGHGTDQENRFYLIPHDLGYEGSRTTLDAAGLKTILSHSISDEELGTAVEGIDAAEMLLVIDACNSGQALEAEEKRRGPMNSKGLAQLAYEKGMYILTAAQSYQSAKEMAKLGHGLLTYALVEEGLKTNAADREPKDGQVMLREWLDYAVERVPQMQQEEVKKRQLVQEQVARADGEDLQRPRVFYRRETEPHPLVIARPVARP